MFDSVLFLCIGFQAKKESITASTRRRRELCCPCRVCNLRNCPGKFVLIKGTEGTSLGCNIVAHCRFGQEIVENFSVIQLVSALGEVLIELEEIEMIEHHSNIVGPVEEIVIKLFRSKKLL